ncbi:MAG: hypothetical protein U0975_16235 [Erythrobacter sp.]|nr:hypothetical protein [Erythrobacter sp.]MDZ4274210.1 hypothetical protein [Erythrobacter sp.]
MWQPDLSDDLTARPCPRNASLLDAADALDRLCARLMIACDILCAVAVFGTFGMTIYHAFRFALRVLG